MREEVEQVINQIRPMLAADGGDVDLVDIVDGVVKLRLRGACHGCPSAAATLHGGIETLLKEKVPGVVVLNQTFFNEFSIRVPGDAAEIVEALAARGILAGVPVSRLEPENPDLRDLIVVAATELTTSKDRDAFVSALGEVLA